MIDVNDNAPVFVQKTYNVTVGENLSLRPPTPVVQVRAEDKDASYNGQIKYTLLEQTEQGNHSVIILDFHGPKNCIY